ncbi:helix-turn-helix domain-containing protein [Emticicia sp. CRIBPO]|uniref:helix-turn-helix domain-containing protein n=1 Tax=Emticicia sp. CRIBPO TaxID=2683258 RepID=UPI001411D9B6|nr:helix-turn-helix domain-containing protein [Emticicia sp. CRIBPO]NBA88054.1 helix-turn-helix domain-containing protein [Emticicia sp. CRIBPO]
MPVTIHLDDILARQKMPLIDLAEKLNITLSDLFTLKTGKAGVIRFSTFETLCEVLQCQPGDILEFTKE